MIKFLGLKYGKEPKTQFSLVFFLINGKCPPSHFGTSILMALFAALSRLRHAGVTGQGLDAEGMKVWSTRVAKGKSIITQRSFLL